MAIVEFTKNCYPYCKSDRLQADAEEQKNFDALAKERGVSRPYKVVEDPKVEVPAETIEAAKQPEGDRVKPLIDQDAAEANLAAPGVEAVQEVADAEAAKASAKKSK